MTCGGCRRPHRMDRTGRHGIKVRGVALVGQLEMGLWSFNQQQHLGLFRQSLSFRPLGTTTGDGQAGRDKVRCHLYKHNILERYLAHYQQRHLGILPVVLFEACSLVAHSEIARSVVLFIFRYISPTDTITQ